MYTTSSAASYFEALGDTQVTGRLLPDGGPLSQHGGHHHGCRGCPFISSMGAYLIYEGMDSIRHSLAHTSRSWPAMLEMAIENLQKSKGITSHKSSLPNSHRQWLLDNYKTAEGVSLP